MNRSFKQTNIFYTNRVNVQLNIGKLNYVVINSVVYVFDILERYL